MKNFLAADIFFITESQLKFTELNDLAGKTVIIDRLSAENEHKLYKAKAKRILILFPSYANLPQLSTSIIEAVLSITQSRGTLTEEEILNYLQSSEIKPQIQENTFSESSIDHFAFIIHPLSKNQITQIGAPKRLKIMVLYIQI